ncbi:MAG TPA: sulfotransferase [Ktedonobacteraceae bacterium]
MKTFPNFFIIGAARSGTTSLEEYLCQHPDIYITTKKESHFFAADHFPPAFKGPGDDRLNERVIRDEQTYTQLFTNRQGTKAIGETSVFYLCYPDSAERIAQVVPDAKIIIVLREPVARAYSAYMFLKRDGRETLDFAGALDREEERKQQDFEPMWRYKELGLYYDQVRHYLEVFGSEQVKVLLYEELYANQGYLLRDVFAFLGVKEDVVVNTSVRYNLSGVPKWRKLYAPLDKFIFHAGPVSRYIKSLVPKRLRTAWASKAIGLLTEQVPIDPELQAQLRAYFAEDVRKLESLLQQDLLPWQYQKPSLV